MKILYNVFIFTNLSHLFIGINHNLKKFFNYIYAINSPITLIQRLTLMM